MGLIGSANLNLIIYIVGVGGEVKFWRKIIRWSKKIYRNGKENDERERERESYGRIKKAPNPPLRVRVAVATLSSFWDVSFSS